MHVSLIMYDIYKRLGAIPWSIPKKLQNNNGLRAFINYMHFLRKLHHQEKYRGYIRISLKQKSITTVVRIFLACNKIGATTFHNLWLKKGQKFSQLIACIHWKMNSHKVDIKNILWIISSFIECQYWGVWVLFITLHVLLP